MRVKIHQAVEHLPCLNVRELYRQGVLQDGQTHLVLNLPNLHIVSLEQRPATLGGYQWHFRCPTCDRRVDKLYHFNNELVCRTCGNLTNRVTQVTPLDRQELKMNRLRKQLGVYDQPYSQAVTFDPPKDATRAEHNAYNQLWWQELKERQKFFRMLGTLVDDLSEKMGV